MNTLKNSDSLKQKAYDFIKNRIVTCELMPDTPISEKDLMRELEVSRTPIREALSRLENEGLVQIYPKRGMFVAGISEKDILDIYTIRETIEPVAARLAAGYMDRMTLGPLLDTYASSNYSFFPKEHIRIDREFHSLIARSCRNDYLMQILINMYDHNSRIRHRLFLLHINEARMEESRSEHETLIRCLIDRDPAGAESTMQRHIANGRKAAMLIINPMYA